MNQNIFNLNFEKETGFHPSFPSDKVSLPQSTYSVFLTYFKWSYQATKGEVRGIKLCVAKKTLNGSIYQHLGIKEPHYFPSPNTHDCTNTNPSMLNKHNMGDMGGGKKKMMARLPSNCNLYCLFWQK